MPNGTVVRFNGGPQAGHNVVTPDGRHHTFSQFGAGTFVPGVRTFLSRFMLIEPYALIRENHHLQSKGVTDAIDRLSIDARCPVITPAHQAANRLREKLRGDAAHGTCGVGVGELVHDSLEHPDIVLHANQLLDRDLVRRKLLAGCEVKKTELPSGWEKLPEAATLREPQTWLDAAMDNYAEVAKHVTIADEREASRILRETSDLIFEGAQGVLLDEDFGFHPHTTWSKTTFANADTLLDESQRPGDRVRLGVLRTYFTRHGAGPFVTENATLTQNLPDRYNTAAGWQGRFRVGVFDAVAARYAIEAAGGVAGLAVTHADCIDDREWLYCDGYTDVEPDKELFDLRATMATRIRPVAPTDLARRERLTECLRRCQPHFASARSFEAMRGILQTSIAITSFGPSASEKSLKSADLQRLFLGD
jgi:adenylosuccinate synthase